MTNSSRKKLNPQDIQAVGNAIYLGYPLKPRDIDTELIRANKEIRSQAIRAIRALLNRGWTPPCA